MATARPHTELVTMPDCGHWLYADDPAGFAAVVGAFLFRVAPVDG